MESSSINDRVQNIKDNNEDINIFIEEYKPFIASCAVKACGKYLKYGEDDELSIALIAFTESIDAYDASKGNFLTFAQGVIRRRIIDYYRKEKKHIDIVSLNDIHSENDDDFDLSDRKALEKQQLADLNASRRLEIEEFKRELEKWDINLHDLVKESPKHKSTRDICSKVIKYIISKPETVEFIMQKKYIPLSDLEKSLKLSRKKIERFRKYIIAMIIIATEEYQFLKEYIKRYID
ncbi:MAG: RNA polymerase sigma-I factor [Clostridiaceae bacterium]|nr:RNA polymerase sigma-I factor [Clostridiaceae bacterium]